MRKKATRDWRRVSGQEIYSLITSGTLSKEDQISLANYLMKENFHSYYDLRRVLAEEDNTPAEVLEILSKDIHYIKVLEAVASHPNTPVNALIRLSKEESEHIRSEVARNPNTPIHILRALTDDEDMDVRARLVYNENLTLDLFDRLSQDEEHYVRGEVASSHLTPPKVLEILSEDEDRRVLENVVGNRNTPPEVIEAMFASGDPDKQAAIVKAYHWIDGEKALEYKTILSNSEDNEVLMALAESEHSTSLEILTNVSESDSRIVIQRLTKNEKITPELLHKIAIESKEKFVKYTSIWDNIGYNHKTRPDTLLILSKDPVTYEIREGLLDNPNMPGEALDNLYEEILKNSKGDYDTETPRDLQKLMGHPNVESITKDKYRKYFQDKKLTKLKNPHKYPSLPWDEKIESTLRAKTNTDLELLKRLKGYLTRA